MAKQILELRNDGDSYHIVWGRAPGRPKNKGLTINITPDMDNMTEEERLVEITKRARLLDPEES